MGRRRPRRRGAGEAAGAPRERSCGSTSPSPYSSSPPLILTFTPHGADVPITLALILAVIRFAPNIRDFVNNSRFTKEEWVAALWIAIGFIGAFGEHAFLHPFLFRLLPIFRATRTPRDGSSSSRPASPSGWRSDSSNCSRGCGYERSSRPLVLALTIADVLPRIEWTSVPAERPPVYHWIALHRPSVFIELPVSPGEPEAQYMLAATTHHVRMMNGVSGFDPPLRKVLVDLCDHGKYDDAFYDILTSNGCKVVVIHNALLGDTAPAMNAWLVSEVQRGKLTPAAHFGDDDVYAITR